MSLHYDLMRVPVAAAEPSTVPAELPGAPAGTAEAGQPRSAGLYRRGGKRALDVLLVCMTLPITLPLVALLALLVACDGRSPFYSQPRVGRGGRIYTIWKLRTMVPQAEARLAEHLAADPAAREEWNHSQKLRRDPRVTTLGRILRKSSIDELPQLWNVLRGDMSLVGPRPMMPQQRSLYPGTAYYRMQPGITGFWQISDRNQTSFSARADYDAAYERDLSPGTDLRVLFGTAAVVVRGTGL